MRATQYFIRQQRKYVSGPHSGEQVRAWVREGKVREDMEFSYDRQEWMLGLEMVELFPRPSSRKSSAVGRAPRRRRRLLGRR